MPAAARVLSAAYKSSGIQASVCVLCNLKLNEHERVCGANKGNTFSYGRKQKFYITLEKESS